MILEKEKTLGRRFLEKDVIVAVIGLGYVGLPIALEFAKHGRVIGFDINRERVKQMQLGLDPSRELPAVAFQNVDIAFTSGSCHRDLHEADVYIIAVPTPINAYNKPDITALLKATEAVGKMLRPGNTVVFESTVYPGCTEGDCVPVLERVSGLHYRQDFKVAYSPERINPGDPDHTTAKITKLVGGCDLNTTWEVASLYQLVIQAGVHQCSSIILAELSKVVENTQRDINIAYMNEVAMIADKLGINTYEMLEAARTKWNFLPFTPGMVGGHCISVDPYYLTYKAEQLGVPARMVSTGRAINESIAGFLTTKLIKALIRRGNDIPHSRVLVMGVTFKPNVADIRNSKIVNMVRELESYGLYVDVMDHVADAQELRHEYSIALGRLQDTYDAVVVATSHDAYQDFTEDDFERMSRSAGYPPLLLDVTGMFRGKFSNVDYLSF